MIKNLAKRFIATSFFYFFAKLISPLINLFRKGIYAYDIAMNYRSIRRGMVSPPSHGPQAPNFILPIISYYNRLGDIITTFPFQPKISILIPIYQVNIDYLEQTFQSVVSQKYKNWEICAVDDASNDAQIKNCLETFQAKYPRRFKYTIHEENLHISETSNTALGMATGEYIGLLDHDDLLYPNALAEMVRFINYTNEPEILYSDERVVNANGDPEVWPFLKPEYLPQLHLSVNYTTHFSVYKASLLRQIGGFRTGYEGSQDHDLMLRAVEASSKKVVHVPMVLYQWRAHKKSTANDISAKNYAVINGVKAVEDALKRRERKASVHFNEKTSHYEINYKLENKDALVSIIIPSKNNANLLGNCVNSIIAKSGTMGYEILIVDNNSTDKDLFQLYDELKKKYSFIHIHNFNRPFNFAGINNFAASQAKGEFLVFLNNDTKILSEDFLSRLVQLAQFPETGAVGAKLLYPNGLVQHAGICLLDRRIAGHAWINEQGSTSRYMNFLKTIHEVTAVTAACLCLEKKKFFDIGGFDEKWVPNGWGDVDFGLKLREKGFTNIYTPHVEILHYESPTRGESLEYFEKFHLIQKYGGPLMKDSFLHPFLCRSTNFDLDPEYATFDLNNKTLNYFLKNENWGEKSYKEFLNNC